MGKYLVGIDQGTSGCKTCVFDLEGNLIGTNSREYACYYPAPGMVEQHGDDMTPQVFDSCKAAIENAGVDADDIIAVALSTQGSVIGLTDNDDKLLRNFIGWQNLRGFAMMEEFYSKISQAELYQITGIPINPTNPIAKLMWLQKFEPENFYSADRFVTQQEYFLRKFGASEYLTDEASCERQGLGDVDNHNFSQRILDVFGFDRKKNGKVVPAGTAVCNIPKHVAERTGLSTKTLLCVGSLDQNATHFGTGIVNDGDACLVLGTMGSSYIVSDKPIRAENGAMVVKSNAGVGNWTIEGMSFTAASSYKWFRDTFGNLETAVQKETGIDAYELLNKEIAQSPPGANGVTFLAFLQGGSIVRYNANARGAFAGISLGTTKSDMARAVMEGICYEMADIILAQEKSGVSVNNIRLAGGAVRSPLWCQMQADIFQKPLFTTAVMETGCMGAAMYAGMGAGVYKDAKDAAQKCVRIKAEYQPNPDLAQAYREGYDRWLSLCEALNGHFYC